MATWKNVAKYILEQRGEMTAMKLQKLMYYCQAWNLVWEEEPLFADDFEAWANGPVLPELYHLHKGCFKVDAGLLQTASSAELSRFERENIGKVLDFYGDKTAQWLSNLSHQEDPWLEARGDLSDGALCSTVIPQSAMHEYYSAL